jgi:hypothetical protein
METAQRELAGQYLTLRAGGRSSNDDGLLVLAAALWLVVAAIAVVNRGRARDHRFRGGLCALLDLCLGLFLRRA